MTSDAPRPFSAYDLILQEDVLEDAFFGRYFTKWQKMMAADEDHDEPRERVSLRVFMGNSGSGENIYLENRVSYSYDIEGAQRGAISMLRIMKENLPQYHDPPTPVPKDLAIAHPKLDQMKMFFFMGQSKGKPNATNVLTFPASHFDIMNMLGLGYQAGRFRSERHLQRWLVTFQCCILDHMLKRWAEIGFVP